MLKVFLEYFFKGIPKLLYAIDETNNWGIAGFFIIIFVFSAGGYAFYLSAPTLFSNEHALHTTGNDQYDSHCKTLMLNTAASGCHIYKKEGSNFIEIGEWAFFEGRHLSTADYFLIDETMRKKECYYMSLSKPLGEEVLQLSFRGIFETVICPVTVGEEYIGVVDLVWKNSNIYFPEGLPKVEGVIRSVTSLLSITMR